MTMSNGRRLELLERRQDAKNPITGNVSALRERLAARLNGIAQRLRATGAPPKSERSIAEILALAVTPKEIGAAESAVHRLLQERGLR